MKETLLTTTLEQVYKALTPRETMRLIAVKERPGIFDSKIGGVPYIPLDMQYPTELNNNQRPLVLIAQLNLDTLGHIEGFPKAGMLQFFWSGMDDMMIDCFEGAAPKANKQDTFRVIYHPHIITDRNKIMSEADFMPVFDNKFKRTLSVMVPKGNILDDSSFRRYYYDRGIILTQKPYLLDQIAVTPSYPTYSDYRFEPLFLKYYYNNCNIPIETVNDIRTAVCDQSESVNNLSDAWLGGFPYFVHADPRELKCLRDYDMLLFEMICNDGSDNPITIGADGTLSFMIPSKNLKKHDFSDVLFYYESL